MVDLEWGAGEEDRCRVNILTLCKTIDNEISILD